MEEFDPKTFVETQIQEIREVVGDEKAIIAVSGGVDSSTCAVLTHLAIEENLLCVILDNAFMREDEPERVVEVLSNPPLNLPMKIERVQERFLKALEGLRDAEEKRKAFRKAFYETLSDVAKREGSRFLVQGTILADVIETKGGIKTQHNVLEQIGISTRELYGFKVVEPLVTLLKWQVRQVARYLKIPAEISERQPFPGPGLSVRFVGEVRPEKMASLKRATTITEEKLAKHKPSQYFAAIIDNESTAHPGFRKIVESTAKSLGISPAGVSARVFADKATGMKGEARKYGLIVGLSCRGEGGEVYQPSLHTLIELQNVIIGENPSVTRVLYTVSEKQESQPYVVAVRAVSTRDFLTARVADIPWSTLKETADLILEECSSVSAVYYDVTPKPPATVEME
ncbi:MAG: GMP synthase [Candidatus Bathyarchaeota archaeon]|nr:GMP synthase [Candidatus Bathyarchaeota archaeon]